MLTLHMRVIRAVVIKLPVAVLARKLSALVLLHVQVELPSALVLLLADGAVVPPATLVTEVVLAHHGPLYLFPTSRALNQLQVLLRGLFRSMETPQMCSQTPEREATDLAIIRRTVSRPTMLAEG